MSPEQPVHELNSFAAAACPKSRKRGCAGCRLFQYTPQFNLEAMLSTYSAPIDALAHPNVVQNVDGTTSINPDFDDDSVHPVRSKSFCISGRGPEVEGGILAVIGSPTGPEDREHTCASGGAFMLMREIASDAGVSLSDWRFTYLSRCFDPTDRVTVRDAAFCAPLLAEEVARLKPSLIVSFGALATGFLLGKPDAPITNYACRPQRVIVAGHETVVYPMYAPGYVFANDWLKRRYTQHFGMLASYLAGNTEVAEDNSQYVIVDVPEDALAVIDRMINFVEQGRVINADIETSGLSSYVPGQRISIISLSAGTKRGYAIMFDHDDCPWSDDDRNRVHAALKQLFRHPKIRLRWHNGMFDTQWFREQFGFWPRDPVEDTMLTHYSVDENMRHGLKDLALLFTDMGDYDAELDRYLDLQKSMIPDAPRYDLVPRDLIGKYAAMDSVATAKLADALLPIVEEQGPQIEALAFRAMPAFSATLARMCRTGVAIDKEFFRNHAIPYIQKESDTSWQRIIGDPMVRKFIRDHEQAERDAILEERRAKTEARVAKGMKPYPYKPIPPVDVKKFFEFSIDSPKQMRELIYGRMDPKNKGVVIPGFEYFNQPILVMTDNGDPSTDKEALQELNKAGSPIAKYILEHRLNEKLLSTYLTPIVDKLDKQGDSTLHGGFLLHGTVTGRLSSRDPNLQNIPNKGAGLIKRGYVSRFGANGVFVQADYSQIELRILACIANDKGMLDAYAKGEDLHLLTACLLFNMSVDAFKALPKDEQKRRRTIAKRVNFGIPYGVGGQGISDMLKGEGVSETPDKCREYIDIFFEAKPAVKRWIDRVQASTAVDECSKSLFGRRRRLEQVRSSVESISGAALRQAVNHPIQSTAADLTMTSLCLIDQEICLRRGMDPSMIHPTIDHVDVPIDRRWKDVHAIVQVHDMIGIDCTLEMAPIVVDRLQYVMENIVDLAPLVWGPGVLDTLKPLRRCRMQAEVEVGPNWRDAYGVKSGADVAKAMHVARVKQAKFDADPHYSWTKEDDVAALASFKA